MVLSPPLMWCIDFPFIFLPFLANDESVFSLSYKTAPLRSTMMETVNPVRWGLRLREHHLPLVSPPSLAFAALPHRLYRFMSESTFYRPSNTTQPPIPNDQLGSCRSCLCFTTYLPPSVVSGAVRWVSTRARAYWFFFSGSMVAKVDPVISSKSVQLSCSFERMKLPSPVSCIAT